MLLPVCLLELETVDLGAETQFAMALLKQFNSAFFRDLWGLVKPYWSESEERWSARALIAVVIVLNLLMVYIS